MAARFLDLMYKYPVPKNRLNERINPTPKDKLIAKKFGKDFFDGERRYGYGGHFYDPKFWTETVQLIVQHYELTDKSKVLDVGCGKGFMLTDLMKTVPGIEVFGIDISEYAISNSHELVKERLLVGNCKELPFPDRTFDLVISINTIHNLDVVECKVALNEIERVKKHNSYIVVDGWTTAEEKKDLESWVLTAKTVLSDQEWQKLFKEAGYTGDYSFWKVQ